VRASSSKSGIKNTIHLDISYWIKRFVSAFVWLWVVCAQALFESPLLTIQHYTLYPSLVITHSINHIMQVCMCAPAPRASDFKSSSTNHEFCLEQITSCIYVYGLCVHGLCIKASSHDTALRSKALTPNYDSSKDALTRLMCAFTPRASDLKTAWSTTQDCSFAVHRQCINDLSTCLQPYFCLRLFEKAMANYNMCAPALPSSRPKVQNTSLTTYETFLEKARQHYHN
jgi:hypothetical protein